MTFYMKPKIILFLFIVFSLNGINSYSQSEYKGSMKLKIKVVDSEMTKIQLSDNSSSFDNPIVTNKPCDFRV